MYTGRVVSRGRHFVNNRLSSIRYPYFRTRNKSIITACEKRISTLSLETDISKQYFCFDFMLHHQFSFEREINTSSLVNLHNENSHSQAYLRSS